MAIGGCQRPDLFKLFEEILFQFCSGSSRVECRCGPPTEVAVSERSNMSASNFVIKLAKTAYQEQRVCVWQCKTFM